jgi:hypothetical protein
VGRRGSFSPGTQEAWQKREGGVNGITLDAAGLIALDRNDRRVIVMLARVIERGLRVTIPATALAQAIRNPAKQVRLSRLIRQSCTDLMALDGPNATAVGLLLVRTAAADIADATSSFAMILCLGRRFCVLCAFAAWREIMEPGHDREDR